MERAAARHDLTEPVIDTAVRVIGPIAADPDPQSLRATVRALVTMNVHSMLALAADATDADLDQLADTLATICERATLPAIGRPTSPQQGEMQPGAPPMQGLRKDGARGQNFA